MNILKDKYNKIKEIMKDYDFSINIDNENLYIDNYDKDIDIYHKKCKNSFKITLKEFGDNKKINIKNIESYLDSKNDKFCPNCIQRAKNLYFSNKLNEKYGGKYKLESDFVSMSDKVVVRHLVCGTIKELKADNLMRIKTEPHCHFCSNILTRAEKMRQSRIQQVSDRYNFSVDIGENIVFKKYIDEEIDIYHKACGRTYKSTLNDFHKINTGSLSYLSEYVEYKSDLHCPHCLQDAKNKYFQEILDKKTNGAYELVGNYNLANSKVTIKHKLCGEIMSVWASNIISLKNPIKCSYCVKLLKSSERVKQNSFIKLMDDFIFPFDIREPYLFKNNLNNVVNIKHKKCGRNFSVEFGKLNGTNIGQIRFLEKYIDSTLDIKCPYCLQEAKNKYFQDVLDELSKGDFILVGNYETTKEDVEILHKSCGKSFKINAGIIVLKKRLSCKMCVNEDNKYQRRIQRKRNTMFRRELKKKGLDEFENIGSYINRTTETTFRHKVCGYEFNDTPEKFLRRVNKCPNCTGNNRVIFKDQKEKNEVFQNRLNNEVQGFELRGDYLGRNKEVTLYHSECKKEFTTKFDYFLNAKCKCPHCQSNRYRYDKDITIKEKIKYFERDLGNDYKILTGFTTITDKVEIRHKRCGKTFTKTINQAIRQKNGSEICPYCEREKRKEKFLKKLDNKWNDSYKLVGEYINADTITTFEHKLCKEKFEATPNQILEKKINSCPNCKDKSSHRLDKFKVKLFKKHKSRYSILSKYVKYDEKMLFKDNNCGTVFWETPYNMLKKELPCKKCATKKRIIPLDEVESRIRKYNGDMYRLAGEYMGTEKDLPVTCNKCGHVFEIAPVKLFRLKICPNCRSKYKK